MYTCRKGNNLHSIFSGIGGMNEIKFSLTKRREFLNFTWFLFIHNIFVRVV